MVIKLKKSAPKTPPAINLIGGGYKSNFAKLGGWKPTPVDPDRIKGDHNYCLTSPHQKLDGVDLDGYGPKISEIIQSPNAWVSTHGSGEHQILHVYAPDARIALRMRFGD